MRRALAACAVAAVVLPASATAQETATLAEPAPVVLRASVKGSLLLSHAPDAPALFPEPTSEVMFWRARVEPTVHAGTLTISAAYEQRLELYNEAPIFFGSSILPADAEAYRIRPLEWTVAEGDNGVWRHGIDRAFARWRLRAADITVGRQAIGWGRGLVFGATDIFSPFSPLESDREWRRGVDAVRAEVPLNDRWSADAVAAFASTVEESAFAGRLRGYAGNVDLEVVGGRRAGEPFGGISSSAAVGDAEVHAEIAAFRVEDPASAPQTVAKALVGGSYQLAIGTGIYTALEYHYSGFGAKAGTLDGALGDPIFVRRLLRGDMQTLGRHALAAIASSELSPELTLGAEVLHSLGDESGIVVPSAIVTFGDRTSIAANAYVPYGQPPAGTAIRSEYGASSLAALVQFRVYW